MIWIILIGWVSEFTTLLWRKTILKYSTLLFFPLIAFHIEITLLADGTYELIQDSDGDFSEAQTNIVELTKAPNLDSEDPKSSDSLDINTGKPRYIFPLFKLCNSVLPSCAFKLLELNENSICIILGTYWLNTRTESV